MRKPEVEEFAALLMAVVRDEAINSCDLLLRPSSNGVTAKRWRKAMAEKNCHDFVAEIIPDCVDQVLFRLLFAIDDCQLRLSFTAKDGRTVDLATEGESEMAGWFAGNVWKAAYSKERFNDDFTDLQ